MDFFKELFSYLADNVMLTAVLIACFIFIGIIVAIICNLTFKAKNAEKLLAERERSTTEQPESETEKLETGELATPIQEDEQTPTLQAFEDTATQEPEEPVENDFVSLPNVTTEPLSTQNPTTTNIE